MTEDTERRPGPGHDARAGAPDRGGPADEAPGPGSPHPGPRRSRRGVAAVALAALLAGALGLALAPRPLHLGEQTTGDEQLAAEVRALLGGDAPYQGLAVALFEGDQLRTAGLGSTGTDEDAAVDADTRFEIGSIAKVLTATLLADLEAEGRLDREATLGAVQPALADAPVGGVRLEELATHRAGLPTSTPEGLPGLVRVLGSTWLGADPYGATSRAALLDAAAGVDVDGRGEPTYSNFAVSLLGHALADHEDTSYAALLDERLLTPLALTGTTLQGHDEDPPTGHAQPHRASGHAVAPWAGEGHAPAGVGPWSSARDLSRLAVATRVGTAPWSSVAEPVYDEPEDWRMGLGWFVDDHDGTDVTWHNGRTGGSAAYVGYTDERAVAVLATTDRGVEHLGLGLLGVDAERDTGLDPRDYPMLAVTLLLPPYAGTSMVLHARRRGHGAHKQPVDRVGLASTLLSALLMLAVVWRAGLWDVVPPALFAASVGLLGVGVALAVPRWAAVPLVAYGRPWARMAGLVGLGAAVLAYLAVLGVVLAGLG